MLKHLSIRTALLALLAIMTLMLLVVSIMGSYAINAGSQSLMVLNRMQGIELNQLYQSRAELTRSRVHCCAGSV